jgi:ABC-type nitrate/sulfonate/bicarbonate transport system, ATPase component
MAAKIELHHVTKRYGDITEGVLAVEDISFQIAPGEFCAILGPSGCGKSTLINLIAGFTPASSGQILLDDVAVRQPGPDRVVVSQDSALFPWKTVRANVEFGLKARALPKAERHRIARYYLNLVHLTACADRYPIELSGGMRQRLALARALAVEPTVLLLDEPLAALDVLMRHALQDELLTIRERTGQTILLVTHDLDEALYLADRVLVMTSFPGRVHTIITVRFAHPRSPALRLTDAFQRLKREVSRILCDLSVMHVSCERIHTSLNSGRGDAHSSTTTTQPSND